MVRKASGPKGRRQAVQRHKIRASKSNGEVPTEDTAGRLSKVAKAIKGYVARACTLFCLVPLVQSRTSVVASGQQHQMYQLAPMWKRIVHYTLMFFYVSFTLYKLAVTAYILLHSGVNAVFVMCFCSALVLLIGITVATTCTSCRPLASLHLLASCDSMAGSLYECTRKRIHVLSNVPFCLKLIAVTWLAHCAAMNAAAFSLVFDDLPVCVFPIVKWVGLNPDNSSMSTICAGPEVTVTTLS